MKRFFSVIGTIVLMGIMAAICCTGQLLPNIEHFAARISTSFVMIAAVFAAAAVLGAVLTASGKAPRE